MSGCATTTSSSSSGVCAWRRSASAPSSAGPSGSQHSIATYGRRWRSTPPSPPREPLPSAPTMALRSWSSVTPTWRSSAWYASSSSLPVSVPSPLSVVEGDASSPGPRVQVASPLSAVWPANARSSERIGPSTSAQKPSQVHNRVASVAAAVAAAGADLGADTAAASNAVAGSVVAWTGVQARR
eukprot:4751150-Prymnesium_polylepis.1